MITPFRTLSFRFYMHFIPFRSLCFFFLICLFSSLSAAPFQYEQMIIEKIDVVVDVPNGEQFDHSGVKGRIQTREGNFFSQSTFDTDLKNLSQEFDRVEPFFKIVNQKLQIVLKLYPKPMIRTVRWDGNSKVDAGDLQKELGIGSGAVFDRLAFNKAFHKLKTYYVKHGFFEAELNYDIQYDPLCNEVDIDISIQEGRCGRIKNIIFYGLTACEESDILDRMATKEYCIFTSWFTNEGTFKEEEIQHDQFAILSYLQNEGFADAHVEIQIAETCVDRINILIHVDKGPLYTISRIKFEGNQLFTDEQIYRQFTLCPGEHYSPDAIRESISNISNLYGKVGYIDTFVDYDLNLDCERCEYHLNIRIEEGDQFRVGLIKVFGNCTTQTNVILHETLLVPGEIFNLEKMQKTEERLQNIGFFTRVNVYAVRSEDSCLMDGNYRDVHIEVEETSTGKFGLFFGYSTVETVFGGFNVTERNFNIAGITSIGKQGLAALRGGGEYAYATVTVGKKSRSYVLSWTKPFFMDTKWSVGFDLEKNSNRYISKDYAIDGKGITMRATYDVNAFVKFGWHYRLRDTDVDVTGDGDDRELIDAARNAGAISATGFSLNYDSTDNPVEPRDGFRSRLETEIAGLGGNHQFWGIAYLNAYYIPIGKKDTLKLRWDARFLVPYDHTDFHTMPLDERLFLGGDSLIRGFRAYKLGPRFDHGKGAPMGGLSMQLLSYEYNRKFHNRVEGYLFCDAGHLSGDKWDFGRLSTAVGFGFRLKLIDALPPINLGYGFPLNERSRGEVKRFFLTFGGRF